MRYIQDIRNYGEDIADFELDPFDSLDFLHLRSKLQSAYDDVTLPEKRALSMYELKQNVDHLKVGQEKIIF